MSLRVHDGRHRRGWRVAIRFGSSALGLVLLSGCTTAYIGIGTVVLGIGAATFAFQCDEPVSVDVWDPTSAHPVCDADVVATKESSRVVFSPCYTTTLPEGTWTVTATKPGFAPAVGAVTVEHEHRCSEPVRHSLELTLTGGAPAFVGAPAPPMPPPYGPNPGAGSAPPNAVPPAPGPSPTGAPAGAAPGSAPAGPAGTSTAPKAGFPPAPSAAP